MTFVTRGLNFKSKRKVPARKEEGSSFRTHIYVSRASLYISDPYQTSFFQACLFQHAGCGRWHFLGPYHSSEGPLEGFLQLGWPFPVPITTWRSRTPKSLSGCSDIPNLCFLYATWIEPKHQGFYGGRKLMSTSVMGKKLCGLVPSLKFNIHPGRLTWIRQITHVERKTIFQTSMMMFYVNLQGCSTWKWMVGRRKLLSFWGKMA